MSSTRITVKTERVVKLPMLPNFILTEGGDSLPIQSLSQEQLQEVGRAWTDALMRKARDKVTAETRAANASLRKHRA
jgi:hypothetical protein